MQDSQIQFLKDYPDLKSALFNLGYSGQQIKKYLKNSQRNLSIEAWKKLKVSQDLLNQNLLNPHYDGPPIKILSEDENFLAIEKPHRIHSYPLKYTETDNALSFIRSIGRGELFYKHQSQSDRNLLFRLDFETAGVLLFYKGVKELKEIRQLEGNQKIYALIVRGSCDLKGSFSGWYQGYGPNSQKVRYSESDPKGGREGSLEVLGFDYSSELDKSLVVVKLISGVRHQIRSFFQAKGFPIIGDDLYGGEKAEFLCLHAIKYEIENFKAYSRPLFLRNFLDLDSRFEMLCDQIGIS